VFITNKCEISLLDEVKRLIQESDALTAFGVCPPVADFDYNIPDGYNVVEVKDCELTPKCNLTDAEQCIENLQKLGTGCRYVYTHIYFACSDWLYPLLMQWLYGSVLMVVGLYNPSC
jgi:hypothetical protein